MFGTHNTFVLAVKMRQLGAPLSKRGQPQYEETRWDDTSVECIPTWVDFGVARKMELAGRDTLVDAIWEVRGWVQEQIEAKAGRQIQTGDLVQFTDSSSAPEQVDDGVWFVLGEREDDHGLFNSIAMEKFNMTQSHRDRR